MFHYRCFRRLMMWVGCGRANNVVNLKLSEILGWKYRALKLWRYIRLNFLKKDVTQRPLAAYSLEPVTCNFSEQLDLNRLRTRLRQKPRTKVGQVRQAWPDIRDLLAAGHTLKDIRVWLSEIGLEIGYARLVPLHRATAAPG